MGCPCIDESDCLDIHLCVPGRQGSFCTADYDDGACKFLWFELEYMRWPEKNGFTYACLDRAINLCLPCADDSDCV